MSSTRAPATSPAASTGSRQIVLAGNPNAGKTTVFNRLTGSTARVGNYPGITVEVESGCWQLPKIGAAELLDVPGSYSLSAHSVDERVAIAAIAGLPPSRPPDAVVIVVDATELSRHLYLVLQICELDVPVVVALTMIDELERHDRSVDAPGLSAALGVPVVPVCAKRGQGLAELSKAVSEVIAAGDAALPVDHWSEGETEAVRRDVEAVADAVPEEWHRGDRNRALALARWGLLSADEPESTGGLPADLVTAVEEHRRLAYGAGRDLDAEIIKPRYDWIDAKSPALVQDRGGKPRAWSDRLDSLLLHPLFGFVIFVAIMTLVFQALFVGANPLIGWIEAGIGSLADLATALLPAGLVADFLVGGVIEGVGAVLVFLPQILLMFLILGLLEDSGYMARVVLLMDRVMKAVGLHGRAFMPLMSGFACAVPAIMATRTMERRRDRLLTMMVVPLMTCSARLPVYGLLIAALYPVGSHQTLEQGMLMAGMYLFAIVISLLAAAVLGRTVLKGRNPPLLMQLPPYRRPQLRSVAKLMYQRSAIFVREAGTVILLCTIGMWALLTFPREPELAVDYAAQRTVVEAQAGLGDAERETKLSKIDSEERGARLRASYAGRLGQAIEPVIEPLGFDWKIGVGLIGSFAAREVFVSTMAVVYGLDQEADENSLPLRAKIRAETRPDGSPRFDTATILSLLVFFALACQCLSTLAAAKRESGGWRWPLFMLGYMSVLAWVASFATYQLLA